MKGRKYLHHRWVLEFFHMCIVTRSEGTASDIITNIELELNTGSIHDCSSVFPIKDFWVLIHITGTTPPQEGQTITGLLQRTVQTTLGQSVNRLRGANSWVAYDLSNVVSWELDTELPKTGSASEGWQMETEEQRKLQKFSPRTAMRGTGDTRTKGIYKHSNWITLKEENILKKRHWSEGNIKVDIIDT
jgi:hypothetical protein